MRASLDWSLRVVAWGLLLSMCVAALHDVSQSWDVWYYHLPFAARLAGVVNRDGYVFHAANEAHFAGFPLLGELLQGLLWRATGRVECSNLVAFAAVPLFAWFLRRRFAVPMHLGLLALLAIPLVQLHATSCYVDLPANAAASVVVLLAIQALAEPAPVSDKTLALALGATAVAANMRFQLHPLLLLSLLALGVRAIPPRIRELRGGDAPSRTRARRTFALVALALPLVFATPLKNAAMHHNPYYPERLHLFGIELPGLETPYSASPRWLAGAPRPVRFVSSLLELGVRPFTERRRWTIDQWMPDDSAGSRMGGFFNAYVVVSLALLAWRVARQKERAARVVGACFAALTALDAVMPQSHELRYYMHWMIVLVSLNLWLACRAPSGDAKRAGLGPRGVGVMSALALGVVLAVTRCGYAYASGSTFAEVLREEVDPALLATIQDGEKVCVKREPWVLLWAPEFHPPKRYTMKEAQSAEDCAGYRELE